MRIRYRELVGKRVVAADGRTLGRVADLIAARHGNELRVTALRVGPAALAQRIGLTRRPLMRQAALTVPWSVIASLGDRIILSVRANELPAGSQEPTR